MISYGWLHGRFGTQAGARFKRGLRSRFGSCLRFKRWFRLGCWRRLGCFHQRCRRAQLQLDRFVAPEFFQVVVLANGRLHDVGYSRTAVDDDPFAIFFAFNTRFGESGITYRIPHAGGEGFGLAV